ncbi:MAG TPA: hypothetical protein PLQ49_01840 [Methanothrix sp.]|nr:hypothetical protein [Methanothrix sp.]
MICLGGYKVCFWRRLIFKAALVGGTIFWTWILVVGIGPGGDIPKIEGEFNWQSAAFALWESVFCLGLVVLIRERFNSGGRVARFMYDNGYSVYVFHPPILILVTLALWGFACIPSSSSPCRRPSQCRCALS